MAYEARCTKLTDLIGATVGSFTWGPWPDDQEATGVAAIAAERFIPGGRLWAEVHDIGDGWSYELLRIATDDIEARNAETLASGESYDLEWVLGMLGKAAEG